MRDEAVAALADAAPGYLGTSHRRDGVRSVVARIRAGIAELFSLPDGYEVLLGNGGSTLFWDAAAFGLIERRSTHLVLGEFSSKFAAVTTAAPHLDDPQVCETRTRRDAARLDAVEGDVYAYPHNETSTGVRCRSTARRATRSSSSTARRPPAACRSRPDHVRRLLLRAAEVLRQRRRALARVLLAPAAIERIERIAATGRWMPPSLDLAIALENSRLEQTYNTPALATLFLLDQQLQWMLAQRRTRVRGGSLRRRRPASLYGWADARPYATPFVTDPALRSHVTATIDFDDAGRRGRARGGAARERHRRRRAVPQARPQPAAHRVVPGDRTRRRRDAHRGDRLLSRLRRPADARHARR